MWYLSVFLSLIFSGVVMSESENEMRACFENVNLEDLKKLVTLEDVSTLEHICPMVLDLMECFEAAVEKQTGLTMEQLQIMGPDQMSMRAATVFNSIRGIFLDVCEDGTELNNAYKRNAQCLESVDVDTEICENNAIDAFWVYRGFANEILDNADENSIEGSEDEDAIKGNDEDYSSNNYGCMMAAYTSACVAAQIHDKCGKDAFDFYQTIVKRSSIFRSEICTEEGLAELKTDFLDSLEHEEEHHKDLFRLAFDLRKRKK